MMKFMIVFIAFSVHHHVVSTNGFEFFTRKPNRKEEFRSSPANQNKQTINIWSSQDRFRKQEVGSKDDLKHSSGFSKTFSQPIFFSKTTPQTSFSSKSLPQTFVAKSLPQASFVFKSPSTFSTSKSIPQISFNSKSSSQASISKNSPPTSFIFKSIPISQKTSFASKESPQNSISLKKFPKISRVHPLIVKTSGPHSTEHSESQNLSPDVHFDKSTSSHQKSESIYSSTTSHLPDLEQIISSHKSLESTPTSKRTIESLSNSSNTFRTAVPAFENNKFSSYNYDIENQKRVQQEGKFDYDFQEIPEKNEFDYYYSEIPEESVLDYYSEIPEESVLDYNSEIPEESILDYNSEISEESVLDYNSEISEESVLDYNSEIPEESVLDYYSSEIPNEFEHDYYYYDEEQLESPTVEIFSNDNFHNEQTSRSNNVLDLDYEETPTFAHSKQNVDLHLEDSFSPAHQQNSVPRYQSNDLVESPKKDLSLLAQFLFQEERKNKPKRKALSEILAERISTNNEHNTRASVISESTLVEPEYYADMDDNLGRTDKDASSLTQFLLHEERKNKHKRKALSDILASGTSFLSTKEKEEKENIVAPPKQKFKNFQNYLLENEDIVNIESTSVISNVTASTNPTPETNLQEPLVEYKSIPKDNITFSQEYDYSDKLLKMYDYIDQFQSQTTHDSDTKANKNGLADFHNKNYEEFLKDYEDRLLPKSSNSQSKTDTIMDSSSKKLIEYLITSSNQTNPFLIDSDSNLDYYDYLEANEDLISKLNSTDLDPTERDNTTKLSRANIDKNDNKTSSNTSLNQNFFYFSSITKNPPDILGKNLEQNADKNYQIKTTKKDISDSKENITAVHSNAFLNGNANTSLLKPYYTDNYNTTVNDFLNVKKNDNKLDFFPINASVPVPRVKKEETPQNSLTIEDIFINQRNDTDHHPDYLSYQDAGTSDLVRNKKNVDPSYDHSIKVYALDDSQTEHAVDDDLIKVYNKEWKEFLEIMSLEEPDYFDKNIKGDQGNISEEFYQNNSSSKNESKLDLNEGWTDFERNSTVYSDYLQGRSAKSEIIIQDDLETNPKFHSLFSKLVKSNLEDNPVNEKNKTDHQIEITLGSVSEQKESVMQLINEEIQDESKAEGKLSLLDSELEKLFNESKSTKTKTVSNEQQQFLSLEGNPSTEQRTDNENFQEKSAVSPEETTQTLGFHLHSKNRIKSQALVPNNTKPLDISQRKREFLKRIKDMRLKLSTSKPSTTITPSTFNSSNDVEVEFKLLGRDPFINSEASIADKIEIYRKTRNVSRTFIQENQFYTHKDNNTVDQNDTQLKTGQFISVDIQPVLINSTIASRPEDPKSQLSFSFKTFNESYMKTSTPFTNFTTEVLNSDEKPANKTESISDTHEEIQTFIPNIPLDRVIEENIFKREHLDTFEHPDFFSMSLPLESDKVLLKNKISFREEIKIPQKYIKSITNSTIDDHHAQNSTEIQKYTNAKKIMDEDLKEQSLLNLRNVVEKFGNISVLPELSTINAFSQIDINNNTKIVPNMTFHDYAESSISEYSNNLNKNLNFADDENYDKIFSESLSQHRRKRGTNNTSLESVQLSTNVKIIHAIGINETAPTSVNSTKSSSPLTDSEGKKVIFDMKSGNKLIFTNKNDCKNDCKNTATKKSENKTGTANPNFPAKTDAKIDKMDYLKNKSVSHEQGNGPKDKTKVDEVDLSKKKKARYIRPPPPEPQISKNMSNETRTENLTKNKSKAYLTESSNATSIIATDNEDPINIPMKEEKDEDHSKINIGKPINLTHLEAIPDVTKTLKSLLLLKSGIHTKQTEEINVENATVHSRNVSNEVVRERIRLLRLLKKHKNSLENEFHTRDSHLSYLRVNSPITLSQILSGEVKEGNVEKHELKKIVDIASFENPKDSDEEVKKDYDESFNSDDYQPVNIAPAPISNQEDITEEERLLNLRKYLKIYEYCLTSKNSLDLLDSDRRTVLQYICNYIKLKKAQAIAQAEHNYDLETEPPPHIVPRERYETTKTFEEDVYYDRDYDTSNPVDEISPFKPNPKFIGSVSSSPSIYAQYREEKEDEIPSERSDTLLIPASRALQETHEYDILDSSNERDDYFSVPIKEPRDQNLDFDRQRNHQLTPEEEQLILKRQYLLQLYNEYLRRQEEQSKQNFNHKTRKLSRGETSIRIKELPNSNSDAFKQEILDFSQEKEKFGEYRRFIADKYNEFSEERKFTSPNFVNNKNESQYSSREGVQQRENPHFVWMGSLSHREDKSSRRHNSQFHNENSEYDEDERGIGRGREEKWESGDTKKGSLRGIREFRKNDDFLLKEPHKFGFDIENYKFIKDNSPDHYKDESFFRDVNFRGTSSDKAASNSRFNKRHEPRSNERERKIILTNERSSSKNKNVWEAFSPNKNDYQLRKESHGFNFREPLLKERERNNELKIKNKPAIDLKELLATRNTSHFKGVEKSSLESKRKHSHSVKHPKINGGINEKESPFNESSRSHVNRKKHPLRAFRENSFLLHNQTKKFLIPPIAKRLQNSTQTQIQLLTALAKRYNIHSNKSTDSSPKKNLFNLKQNKTPLIYPDINLRKESFSLNLESTHMNEEIEPLGSEKFPNLSKRIDGKENGREGDMKFKYPTSNTFNPNYDANGRPFNAREKTLPKIDLKIAPKDFFQNSNTKVGDERTNLPHFSNFMQTGDRNIKTDEAGRKWPDEDNDGMPGVAGRHYPNFKTFPKTKFSCHLHRFRLQKFYPDYETGCQVYHDCSGSIKRTFLCPRGFIFDVESASCRRWYNTSCQS